ncbi:GTP binding protein, partial [Coemansia reversa NRRL 1564]
PDARSLKQRLLHPDDDDMMFLSDMVDQRLTEGQGEAVIEIGYEANGVSMDLTENEVTTVTATLTNAAQTSKSNAFVQLLFDSAAPIEDAKEMHMLHYLVRRRPENVEEMLELRVAVAGNVDAGKSTMLGVLTRGRLDDGRGKMRVALFRHKHEIESGRTSSVGMEILGFDKINGAPVRHADSRRKVGWDLVCSRSSKMVTFLDLAGHEKYLKTTVFGIAGSAPDYLMLMIAANAGLAGMAKEHLGLALALNIPVFVVITKIDMCPPNVLDTTLKQLTRVLRSSGCRKLPIAVSDRKSVVMAASRFVSQRVCPIFQVSNVTGEGVDSLQTFINIIPITAGSEVEETLRYDINEIFTVPFVGTVVSGVVSSGCVKLGDTVWLGPDFYGKFTTTTVRGIQRKRADVQTGHRGQSVSLALKKITRAQVRKGMVILGKDELNTMPLASRTFEAEVVVLYHSTTITMRYQAMVHCGAVRQTARVLTIEPIDSKEDISQNNSANDTLRTGDRARVVFQFVRHPEHIAIGSRLIFREGRTKGVGKVLRVLN